MLHLQDMCQNHKTAKLLFMVATSNPGPSSSADSQANLIMLTVKNNLLEDMLSGSRVHALDNKKFPFSPNFPSGKVQLKLLFNFFSTLVYITFVTLC